MQKQSPINFELNTKISNFDYARNKRNPKSNKILQAMQCDIYNYFVLVWHSLLSTSQTSYWEGWWHQNWVRIRPTKKMRADTQIREKMFFFTLRKRRKISGWVQWVKWSLRIGQQMPCWQKVAAGPFWLCLACPKLGDAGRTRVASKTRALLRKIIRPQF